jgi:hypothetical protein
MIEQRIGCLDGHISINLHLRANSESSGRIYCVSRSSEVQIFVREPHSAQLSHKNLYLIQAQSAMSQNEILDLKIGLSARQLSLILTLLILLNCGLFLPKMLDF